MGYMDVAPSGTPSFTIQQKRESYFLAGRYLKFSRNVSSTLWLLGNEDDARMGETSVEEVLAQPIKEALKPARTLRPLLLLLSPPSHSLRYGWA